MTRGCRELLSKLHSSSGFRQLPAIHPSGHVDLNIPARLSYTGTCKLRSLVQDRVEGSFQACNIHQIAAGCAAVRSKLLNDRKLTLTIRSKSANATSAHTRLHPRDSDDRIDIILIRRAPSKEPLGCKVAPNSVLSGYTILIPPHWAMAFWASLTYSSARVIGLEEWRHQHLEAGLPYFPDDWMCTAAGEAEAMLFRAETLKQHAARPPARRTRGLAAHVASSGTDPVWSAALPATVELTAAQIAPSIRRTSTTGYPTRQRQPNSANQREGVEARSTFFIRLFAISGNLKPGAQVYMASTWATLEQRCADCLDEEGGIKAPGLPVGFPAMNPRNQAQPGTDRDGHGASDRPCHFCQLHHVRRPFHWDGKHRAQVQAVHTVFACRQSKVSLPP
jgi:hypothetical protein